MKPQTLRHFSACALGLYALAARVQAAGSYLSGPSAPKSEASGGQSLEQAASDPTASLVSMRLQNGCTGANHDATDKTGDTVLVCVAHPVKRLFPLQVSDNPVI